MNHDTGWELAVQSPRGLAVYRNESLCNFSEANPIIYVPLVQKRRATDVSLFVSARTSFPKHGVSKRT